jgi:hypothetical protein
MLERRDTILKALSIIAQAGGKIGAFDFGRAMWPKSRFLARDPGKVTKPAAGMLGRLSWAGLVGRYSRGIYGLTERGRTYLAYGGSPPVAPAPPPPPPAPAPPPQPVQGYAPYAVLHYGSVPPGWWRPPR